MMLTLMTLALSGAQPAPPTALIGCHPHPGKVMACATPYGVSKPSAKKMAEEAAPDQAPAGAPRHCHPDPSKNRGCMRPVPFATR